MVLTMCPTLCLKRLLEFRQLCLVCRPVGLLFDAMSGGGLTASCVNAMGLWQTRMPPKKKASPSGIFTRFYLMCVPLFKGLNMFFFCL